MHAVAPSDQLLRDATPTEGESQLWLQRTTVCSLDVIQWRRWAEGDPRGGRAKQYCVLMAKTQRPGPCLPALCDCGSGIDAGQYGSQPAFSQ